MRVKLLNLLRQFIILISKRLRTNSNTDFYTGFYYSYFLGIFYPNISNTLQMVLNHFSKRLTNYKPIKYSVLSNLQQSQCKY